MNNNNRRHFLKTTGAVALGSTLPFQLARAAGENITVGFIYPGARDDFGYIQAHAQAAASIKKMPGVKVIEEENVPETFAAQQTMRIRNESDTCRILRHSNILTHRERGWRRSFVPLDNLE